MAKRKPEKRPMPMGQVLKANLRRLQLTEEVVRSAEIIRRIKARTGRDVTRQRIAALVNAIYIEPETIAWLADGLGVTPEDLLREPKGDGA